MKLDVVTVNSKDPYQDLVQFVEEGTNLFPLKIVDSINYAGEVEYPYDKKLFMNEEPIPSFDFRKLILRLNRIKGKNPLMAIITNHLVYLESIFQQNGKYKISYMPIRDYMEEVGFVCLLRLADQHMSKVIAHTIGHSRGLGHHKRPIDLMYAFLEPETHYPEPFCENCIYTLERSEGFLKM